MQNTQQHSRIEYNRGQHRGRVDVTREDRLADLLERWESAASTGRRPTPEELCQDTPEDLPAFRNLLKQLGAAGLVTASGPPIFDSHSSNFRAGRYTAYDYHAEGGLGVVYRAKDEELNRTVALKCMKAAGSATSPIGQRFLLEAEITSQLDHPGIAPVHGRGQMDDGRPYYAMRFIDGETLQDATKRYHLSTASDRNVEFRRLLKAFVGVCETMAYAHSRGVIHRDLKPSNVMVGPFGEVLVMDWGLARNAMSAEPKVLKEPTSAETDPGPHSSRDTPVEHVGTPRVDFTVYGRAKGSPSFMSPEQARGEWDRVGPASDVYSLGSTLYYLLTGKVPFEGKSSGEVVERVRVGEFTPPRTVNASISPALDAICRKAMSLQLESRYSNAHDLAEDVERWLADEPVSAWQEPFSIRVRRWMRRHRTLMTASAAVVVVGIILLAIYGYRLDRKNDELQVQRNRAEERFQSALESNSQLVNEIQTALVRLPGTREVRESLLRDAIKRLDKLLENSDQTRDVNRVTLKARLQLGDLYRDVEQNPTKAVAEYQRGLELANSLRQQNPDDSAVVLDTVATLLRLGQAYAELGQYARSAELYLEANQLLEKLGPEGDEARAKLLSRNAELLLEKGDAPAALANLSQARKIQEQGMLAATIDDANSGLAETILAQGQTAIRSGKYTLAISHFSEALEKLAPLEKQRPTDVTIHRFIARAHNGLASAHLEIEQHERASTHANLFFQRAKQMADQDPENCEVVLQLAFAHGSLALDLGQRFEIKLAEQHFAEFHRLVEKLGLLDRNNLRGRQNYALGLSKLGMSALNLRKHKEAAARLDEAIKVCREILQLAPERTATKADLAEWLKDLAQTYLQYLPDKERGLAALMESQQTWSQLVESDPSNVAWQVRSLEPARLLAHWQRTLKQDNDRAEASVRDGLSSAEKFTGPDREIPQVRKAMGLLRIELAYAAFGRAKMQDLIGMAHKEIAALSAALKDRTTWDLLLRNYKLLFDNCRRIGKTNEANAALKKTIEAARAGLAVDRDGAEFRAQIQLHLVIEAEQMLYIDPVQALKLLNEAIEHSPRFPADLAEHAAQRQRFAALEMRAGDCSEMLNRPMEALAHYERMLVHHEAIAKGEPEAPGIQGTLAYDHRRMAEIRLYLLDFEGSLKDYQKSQKILDQMKGSKIKYRIIDDKTKELLKENLPFVMSLPKSIETLEEAEKQPTSVRMNALRIRIAWLLKNGRMDEAVATANRMAEQKLPNGNAFALAAVEFGRLAIEHAAKSKEHVARSLELLRKAKAAGYFGGSEDIAWLKWETFFTKVREDAGFAMLLKELEKK